MKSFSSMTAIDMVNELTRLFESTEEYKQTALSSYSFADTISQVKEPEWLQPFREDESKRECAYFRPHAFYEIPAPMRPPKCLFAIMLIKNGYKELGETTVFKSKRWKRRNRRRKITEGK